MKTSKLFTIDVELAEKLLDIKNASRLVNDLLTDYFKINAQNNTIIDKKELIIKDLKKKPVNIKRKLEFWKSLKNWASTDTQQPGLEHDKQNQPTSKSYPTAEIEDWIRQKKILNEGGS